MKIAFECGDYTELSRRGLIYELAEQSRNDTRASVDRLVNELRRKAHGEQHFSMLNELEREIKELETASETAGIARVLAMCAKQEAKGAAARDSE